MGKSSINGPFPMAMLNNQRVSVFLVNEVFMHHMNQLERMNNQSFFNGHDGHDGHAPMKQLPGYPPPTTYQRPKWKAQGVASRTQGRRWHPPAIHGSFLKFIDLQDILILFHTYLNAVNTITHRSPLSKPFQSKPISDVARFGSIASRLPRDQRGLGATSAE